jgi:hypothetical protein
MGRIASDQKAFNLPMDLKAKVQARNYRQILEFQSRAGSNDFRDSIVRLGGMTPVGSRPLSPAPEQQRIQHWHGAGSLGAQAVPVWNPQGNPNIVSGRTQRFTTQGQHYPPRNPYRVPVDEARRGLGIPPEAGMHTGVYPPHNADHFNHSNRTVSRSEVPDRVGSAGNSTSLQSHTSLERPLPRPRPPTPRDRQRPMDTVEDETFLNNESIGF